MLSGLFQNENWINNFKYIIILDSFFKWIGQNRNYEQQKNFRRPVKCETLSTAPLLIKIPFKKADKIINDNEQQEFSLKY